MTASSKQHGHSPTRHRGGAEDNASSISKLGSLGFERSGRLLAQHVKDATACRWSERGDLNSRPPVPQNSCLSKHLKRVNINNHAPDRALWMRFFCLRR